MPNPSGAHGLIMDVRAFTCRLPGCNGPRSGVCINNLSFEECPDVIPVEQSDDYDRTTATDEPSPAGMGMVSTGGGRSLDAAACDALLRERGGFVIGLVAGPEIGKTTMIGTIYELIHRGRMFTFRFAGSETLRGYEERCHRARIASNGFKPDTPRTRTADQLSFTHLRLATAAGMRDVVFSDRSGEHFENILAKPSGIAGFAELERASAVLLLVDSEKMRTSAHQPTSQVRRLFMAMEQSGLLQGKPVVLVGTKADLLATEEDMSEARTMLARLTTELNRRAGGRATVTSALVASRARKGTSDIGHGLEALLGDLLRDPEPPDFTLGTAQPASLTEVDALMHAFRSKRP